MWTVEIGGSIYPVNFEYISTELNGHEEAVFSIENNEVSQNTVSSDRDVIFRLLGRQGFFGVLA